MTKLKQVFFAAGLVAVGYRLGAKSPAAAAPGGSHEFRDEVTPDRKPSSKSKASRCQVVPAPKVLSPVPAPSAVQKILPSGASFESGPQKKKVSLIKDCSDYSWNWHKKNEVSRFDHPAPEQQAEYYSQFQEHWAQAFQTSSNWRGTARISIDGSSLTIDALYNLRRENDGQICWSVSTYSTQAEGVFSLSSEGGCGDQSVNWINGAAVISLHTYYVDTVGDLISAVMLPMDPSASTNFEYFGVSEEKWESAGMMMFQPLSDNDLSELQIDFQNKIADRRSGGSRSPASDP